MTESPFYHFRNSTLVFEVESDDSDELDSSGNPQPGKTIVTIEAFLKPVKSARKKYSDYPNLSTSEEQLTGFIVDPPDGFPLGVSILDKTVRAKYRDQEGEFTRTVSLQSCVEADLITGYPISGIFRIIGGS